MNAEDYNKSRIESGVITQRDITTLVRHWQATHGLDVDGKAGPKTLASLQPISRWAPYKSIIHRPRTQRDVVDVFGNPGKAKADPTWERKYIIECHEKHGNRLPNVPTKWYVKIHRLIEPALREALKRAGDVSEYRIERIAGFVFRHQRHDSSLPLSYHSWGIAVDIDSYRNRAQTFRAGECPRPWSDEWIRRWPAGVDRDFVDAFQSVGFVWGGDWGKDPREITFADPMHFQYVG